MKKTWFNMAGVAKDGGGVTAQIDVHDEIGAWGITAQDFMRDLAGLGDVDEINLSMHSPGGSVIDGLAIYNSLKMHKAKVTGTVQGLAASMGSVIMMACDVIKMPANSYMMIHNVAGGAWGGSDDLRDTADLIDKLGGNLTNIYVDRAGQDADKVGELMSAETWMDGEEAMVLGFCDEVLDEVQAVACAQLDSYTFKNMPAGAVSPLVAKVADDVEPTWLGKLTNLVTGKVADTDADDAASSSAAQLTELRAELAAKDGLLSSALADVGHTNDALESARAVIAEQEATAKEAFEIISEAGFSAAGLKAKLPAPGASGGDAGNMYVAYQAIENKEARQAFFKKNKDAIYADAGKVK